jgi:hypothetical protein
MGFTSRYVKRDELPNPQNLRGRIELAGNLPDDAYIVGVPKNVFRLTNFVGNVGTGLDTLLSFVFPARSLKANQLDHFRASFGLGFGSNDDNKRVQLSFAGNVLFNSSLLDIDLHGAWIDLIVFRLSNTTFNAGLVAILGQLDVTGDIVPILSSTGAEHTARNHNIITLSGGTSFDANDQTLLLEAESATATNNNIIVNIASVELTRF